jgi:hypothetical protein
VLVVLYFDTCAGTVSSTLYFMILILPSIIVILVSEVFHKLCIYYLPA